MTTHAKGAAELFRIFKRGLGLWARNVETVLREIHFRYFYRPNLFFLGSLSLAGLFGFLLFGWLLVLARGLLLR